MPAAKKTTKKPTKTLKTNNVTGRKKILLISVLVLVVIGVAAIVRSFAATTQQTGAWASNDSRLVCSFECTPYNDTGKANIKVLALRRNGVAVTKNTYQTDQEYLSTGLYQICVTGKGVTYVNTYLGDNVYQPDGRLLFSNTSDGKTSANSGSLAFTDASNYATKCITDYFSRGSNGVANDLNKIQVKNLSGNGFSVSMVTLNKLIADPTPVVTPTTSKNGGK